tara:strand:+ start:50 stop:157 length:108 start_codon:yes stop_codon:yes gene_type:complete
LTATFFFRLTHVSQIRIAQPWASLTQMIFACDAGV